MGALDRTLRYLGLGGASEPDSLAADMAAHRGTRPEPAALGAGLVFRGELGGDGIEKITEGHRRGRCALRRGGSAQ